MADLNNYNCYMCGSIVVGARLCATCKATNPMCQRIAATWYPTVEDERGKKNGKT